MADSPPEDTSGHPHAAGNPSQPLQPVLTEMGSSSESLTHPQPYMELSRPPLAELNQNGEPFSGKKASKLPHNRPSMGASFPKIKKKKSMIKSHPFHLLSNEEIMQLKLKEVNTARIGCAKVVQPLQTMDAMDAHLDEEGDDDSWSDEEEDGEFDIESFQVDEEKRAELASLMEKYEVYDEEQLRLAIRRERNQKKNFPATAVMPYPSSESAPASPNGSMSRFVPPRVDDFLPRSPIIPPEIELPEEALSLDGKSTLFPSPSPKNPPHTIPMQIYHNPTDPHVHLADVAAHLSTPPNSMHTSPMLNTYHPPLPISITSNPSITTHPTHTHNPNPPLQAETQTGPIQAQSISPLPNSGLTVVDQAKSSLSSVAGPNSSSRAIPDKPTSVQAPQTLPASGDLNEFPPLPKGSAVHENGGSEDIVMTSADERDPTPRPCGEPPHIIAPPHSQQAHSSALAPNKEGASRPDGAPNHVIPPSPTEQAHNLIHSSAPAPAPRPPTTLAERVRNSAPPSAPVAFNPTKYTPIGAKGDREGTPVVSFSKTDTECLAGRVGLAVVGKFSHSI